MLLLIRTFVFLVFPVAFLVGCKPPPENTEETILRKQEDYKKFDIHTHYRYDREFLVPLLEKWNMKTLLVEVALVDSSNRTEKWEALKTQHNNYKDRFYLCAAFESSGIDDPSFADNIIAMLKDHLASGARMVKVWKNHGMIIQDLSGAYVQIDDPRIQPVWDFLTEEKIPVIAHIGEPIQAWRELEEGNPHYNYYKNHPEYHAYQHPEIPSWETIIAARDNWVAKNPNLLIVAAHMGSMSHDVGLVAERLDKYPNFYAETAARWGDIVRQNSEVVRNFFIKYQDRLMYGTDLSSGKPPVEGLEEADKQLAANIETMFEMDWQYLTTGDSMTFDDGMISFPIETKGIDLPDSVLKKFYYQNAVNILRTDQ